MTHPVSQKKNIGTPEMPCHLSLQKCERNWAELTFAKTSETVIRDMYKILANS